MSPFLFIIMAEALRRSITKAMEEGLWKGIIATPEVEPITHQQFSDDTILFGDASRCEANNIKKLLDDYKKAFDKA